MKVAVNDDDTVTLGDTSSSGVFIELNPSTVKYSVFTVSPPSGSIPPQQKQVARIEFNPRQLGNVLFKQPWCIDTRVDVTTASSSSTATVANDNYQCRLILVGKSLSPKATGLEDQALRDANRVLKNDKTKNFYQQQEPLLCKGRNRKSCDMEL